MNEDTTALMKQVESDAMTTWSDERRKEFVDTFDKRSRVSQFLLIRTADKMAERATKEKLAG